MKNKHSNQFSAPWWAKSPHVQTILPVFTKEKKATVERERLELEDGDFIDLDWLAKPQNGQPLLVLIHGLEGSVESHYIRRMLKACQEQNLAAVVHHHRSCSGENNRLARSYHSGDTQDVKFNFSQLRERFPDSPLLAIGYSLGGNVLTKYQGEMGHASLLARAVVVSAPLQLNACAKRLEKGFSKVYQRHLIKQLQQKTHNKLDNLAQTEAIPIDKNTVDNLTTFHQFDDKITAPLHGFNGVDDYYTRSSGMQFLSDIEIPTLIIHAADDPFMTEEVIPSQDKLSAKVEYELHYNGGHVGFIEGGSPLNPKYYLERRALNFLLGS